MPFVLVAALVYVAESQGWFSWVSALTSWMTWWPDWATLPDQVAVPVAWVVTVVWLTFLICGAIGAFVDYLAMRGASEDCLLCPTCAGFRWGLNWAAWRGESEGVFAACPECNGVGHIALYERVSYHHRPSDA